MFVDIRLGDWQASNHPGTTKSRQVNYVVPLNYSIGPKSAETEDIQVGRLIHAT